MKLLLISLLLGSYLSTAAQHQIGIKAGISIPNLEGNNPQSKGYTSTIGFYGGVLINFPITSSIFLQPEINFSPQGGQRKGMQEIPADAIGGVALPPDLPLYANFKSVTEINYLEIPVLFKLVLGQKLKYYLCLGPHVSFLLSANTKTSGSSPLYLDEAGTIPLVLNGSPLPSYSFDSKTNITESIKRVNAGLQGGLGIEKQLGYGSLFLEGRGIIGLLNIQRHPETDGKNHSGSLAIAAGYLIKIR